MSSPVLLISLGDPNGIGPEVTAKSVGAFARTRPVVMIGPGSALSPWRKWLGRSPVMLAERDLFEKGNPPLPNGLYLIDPVSRDFKPTPGRMTRSAACVAFRSFEIAVDLLRRDPRRFSLVTAPVSKEACIRAGIKFSGHTGYLAGAFGVHPLMLLMAGDLRVALLTEHVPLLSVPAAVTAPNVLRALMTLASGLTTLGVTGKPTLAILGLNPHAGEGGKIGREDRTIATAIRAFNRLGLGLAVGPLPADSAFAPEHIARLKPAAFLAMYHDQGLIPVKREGIGRTVNITLGLPARRTSPAHGTAFDIAGRGVADPASMRLAIRWAVS